MANNSIALLAQAPVFDTPLESQAKAMQIRNLMHQGETQDMDMQVKRQGIQRAAGLQSTLAGLKPGATPDEQVGILTRGGYLPEARSLAESSSKVSKDKREAEKFEIESHFKKFELAGQIMNGVKDQASWDRARAQTAQIFGQEAAAQMPAQYDPKLIEEKRAQATDVKTQLEQHWKQMGYDQDERKFGETVRSNKAQERTQAGQLAVSQGNLGVSRQREARESTAPRGQVVQTDQGVMLVDPRSGNSTAARGPDGQPLQPKLKSLPAPVQRAISENSASLRKVESALKELDAYPEAFGLKNYLGDTVRQRSDPQGIRARALVADIGSLKIHDRSGAAVTASETPRLKPFIPATTDDPATVKKKLGLFHEEYKAMQEDMVSMYSRDQGYRQPGAAPAAAGGKPTLGQIFGE